MSLYEIHKLMFQLNDDPDLAVQCAKATPEEVLAAYKLTDEERAAVRVWNLRALYNLGVNPFLLLSSSVSRQVGLMEYITEINLEAGNTKPWRAKDVIGRE
jgi:hypothetical protein